MFSKARVGDKVFHLRHGDGRIACINPDNPYPVRAIFKGETNCTFKFDGREMSTDTVPMLFWSMPIIKYPDPPKRKVTRFMLVLHDYGPDNNQYMRVACTTRGHTPILYDSEYNAQAAAKITYASKHFSVHAITVDE